MLLTKKVANIITTQKATNNTSLVVVEVTISISFQIFTLTGEERNYSGGGTVRGYVRGGCPGGETSYTKADYLPGDSASTSHLHVGAVNTDTDTLSGAAVK